MVGSGSGIRDKTSRIRNTDLQYVVVLHGPSGLEEHRWWWLAFITLLLKKNVYVILAYRFCTLKFYGSNTNFTILCTVKMSAFLRLASRLSIPNSVSYRYRYPSKSAADRPDAIPNIFLFAQCTFSQQSNVFPSPRRPSRCTKFAMWPHVCNKYGTGSLTNVLLSLWPRNLPKDGPCGTGRLSVLWELLYIFAFSCFFHFLRTFAIHFVVVVGFISSKVNDFAFFDV
jgi:hypothetical protein